MGNSELIRHLDFAQPETFLGKSTDTQYAKSWSDSRLWEELISNPEALDEAIPYLAAIEKGNLRKDVPHDIHKKITARIQEAETRALHAYQEQRALSQWFEDELIEIVWTGPIAWSQVLYAKKITRPVKRLELLVQNQTYHKILSLLGRFGYRKIARDQSDGRWDIELRRSLATLPLLLRRKLVPGELDNVTHTRWERKKSLEKVELPPRAYTLSLEDHLLDIVNRIGRNEGAWRADLTFLLRHAGEMDLDLACENLKQAGLVPTAYFAFEKLASNQPIFEKISNSLSHFQRSAFTGRLRRLLGRKEQRIVQDFFQ